MAPGAGLEPATSKLTASCSTIELPGITYYIISLLPNPVNLILKNPREAISRGKILLKNL